LTDRVAGQVTRAHGLNGEVAIKVLTSVAEVRFAPGARLVEVDGDRVFTVQRARADRDRLLVLFEEIKDRSTAESLRGLFLAGEREVSPPEGEVWASVIEGYEVVDTGGEKLGVVREVVESPAHDLLLVDRAGSTPALIPFVSALIREIDHVRRTIVLDPPEGLI
jgi:16S rRNA processing protein RimM